MSATVQPMATCRVNAPPSAPVAFQTQCGVVQGTCSKVGIRSFSAGVRHRLLPPGLYNPLRLRVPAASRNDNASRSAGGSVVKVQALRQDVFVRVEGGDTLGTLSKAFGVSKKSFLESNQDLIASEHLIFEGDLLRVPAKAWKGQAPPGLEGRVVIRTTKTIGDAFAGVGTAVQLLPSYLGLDKASSRLPPGVGGWLILSGVCLVVLGVVGRLMRMVWGKKPTEAPKVAPGKPVILDKLGNVVVARAYAAPGMPPSLKGPYTGFGSSQTPDMLPNKNMQASILATARPGAVSELSPPNSTAPGTKSEMLAKEKVAEQKRKQEEGERQKREAEDAERKQKELVLKQQEAELAAAAKASSAAAAATAAAAASSSSSSAAAAAAAASPTLEPAPAPVAVAVATAPVVDAPTETTIPEPAVVENGAQRQGGWRFTEAVFGKDSSTALFRFGPDTGTASPVVAEEAHKGENGGATGDNGSAVSDTPPRSSRPYGPYTVGWTEEASKASSSESGAEPAEEPVPENLTMAQQAVKSALPALALTLGAVSAVTSGWQGAMEAIGLTFVGSFVTYDLLWADERQKLLKEIKNIRSPKDVAKFLEDRGISPK